jgi:hypothetical protein
LRYAEGRARDNAEELETVRKAAAAEAKALKAQCANLAQQLRHSEHRVNAKERVVEKLMAKLHGEVSMHTSSVVCTCAQQPVDDPVSHSCVGACL